MIPRLIPIAFALATLLAPHAAAAQAVTAAPGNDDALPEAGLVPVPRLVPPRPVNPPALPSAARPPQPFSVPAVPPSDGANFLRADRIDGIAIPAWPNAPATSW